MYIVRKESSEKAVRGYDDLCSIHAHSRLIRSFESCRPGSIVSMPTRMLWLSEVIVHLALPIEEVISPRILVLR